MIQYLKIKFTNRRDEIQIPTTEDDSLRLQDCLRDREDGGFVEICTLFDQHVWINLDNVQVIDFLLDHTNILPVELHSIVPSKQFPDDESEPVRDDIFWNIYIWIQGVDHPRVLREVDGHDWVEIFTSFSMSEKFFIVTDEDQEPVAISISNVDILIGTEIARYSDNMLELIEKEINPQHVPPAHPSGC